MDIGTFGNSPAAINLLTILEESDNIQYRRRTCHILSRWFDYSGEITRANMSPIIARGTLDIWRPHFLKWVDDSNFPTNIKTHTKCVVITRYRQCKIILDYKAQIHAKRIRELTKVSKHKQTEGLKTK